MNKSFCAVCGKPFEEGKTLVMAEDGKISHVCFSCASKISNLALCYKEFVPCGSSFSSENLYQTACDLPNGDSSKIAGDILRPVQIKGELDKYIIGQERAKKVISIAVYNHYKRTTFQNRDIKKSNILLVGPTGSGKTYLVETLAKIMNVPVALCTATTLTEAGYIGKDVESVVQRLFEVCDHDIEKTQRGIIFIDEVDKLCASGSDTEKKVGGKGVQQALLRLLEGTVVSVPVSKGVMGQSAEVEIDTSNILFICGGAFPLAEEIISRRINKRPSIGYISDVEQRDEVKGNLLLHVTPDDLKTFGMIPEFLGRLPVIAPLEELSVETLIKILSVPKGCLLSQYQQLFDYDGIRLVMEEGALRRVAEIAINKGTGARSLRAVMEEVLEELMFELPGKNIEEVVVTEGFVDKKDLPVIKERIPKSSACVAG